jgi:hypothetical protein
VSRETLRVTNDEDLFLAYHHLIIFSCMALFHYFSGIRDRSRIRNLWR